MLSEYEIDGENEQNAGYDVIPSDLHVECDDGKCDENNQSDDFLKNFELHKAERTAIARETDTVGRHLEAVFKKGYSPTEGNDSDERELLKPFEFAELEMAVPSESHENVGTA